MGGGGSAQAEPSALEQASQVDADAPADEAEEVQAAPPEGAFVEAVRLIGQPRWDHVAAAEALSGAHVLADESAPLAEVQELAAEAGVSTSPAFVIIDDPWVDPAQVAVAFSSPDEAAAVVAAAPPAPLQDGHSMARVEECAVISGGRRYEVGTERAFADADIDSLPGILVRI